MDSRVDLYVMLGGYAVIRFDAHPQERSDTAVTLKVPRSECSDLISGGLPCFLETDGQGRVNGEIERVTRKNGHLTVQCGLVPKTAATSG